MIDIDDDLLTAAQAEAGTATYKDTVNEALRLLAGRRTQATRSLEELYERIGVGLDIADEEIMKGARR